ncbi:LysE family translocator [Amylibacter sp. SFDW26]|uniref:LysE family translocator n=1 Tax=Amylibacter sp. SFDW26 TaxID=2652722 RepID=UPI00126256CD|nr:LysE family translocator [Amylibacter sp. SFDW26]KAB7614718.1 LysE family translocator [Amylibacter sp. SFDW26]
MTFEHLIIFNIALLAALASPGPAFLVMIRTTLNAGRTAGIALGFGLGSVAAMWTLMALLGLDTVFKIFPWAYTAVKIIGAVYLLYIAFKMWRSANDVLETETKPSNRAFLQGVLINLLNPKSVLFAAAVLVVIFPKGMTFAENATVVLNHLIVELMFYTAMAIGMSTKTVSAFYIRLKKYIDRVSSVVLGALGIRLLTQN